MEGQLVGWDSIGWDVKELGRTSWSVLNTGISLGMNKAKVCGARGGCMNDKRVEEG